MRPRTILATVAVAVTWMAGTAPAAAARTSDAGPAFTVRREVHGTLYLRVPRSQWFADLFRLRPTLGSGTRILHNRVISWIDGRATTVALAVGESSDGFVTDSLRLL